MQGTKNTSMSCGIGLVHAEVGTGELSIGKGNMQQNEVQVSVKGRRRTLDPPRCKTRRVEQQDKYHGQ